MMSSRYTLQFSAVRFTDCIQKRPRVPSDKSLGYSQSVRFADWLCLNLAIETFGRRIVEHRKKAMRNIAIKRASTARTINPRRYARLLAQRLPTIIRTEKENEKMLAAIWELMKKGEDNLAAEELALLELMSVLVERFEEEHYPIPDAPPHRILQHLIESRNIKQADLVPILGGRGRVSELVNSKRAISKAQAKALADFFHVSVELFL